MAEKFDEKYPNISDMAKLGIIALIDEATKYQEVRPKDALKKELKKIRKNRKTRKPKEGSK